jgi:PTS system cellobiose-specific IIC component
MNRFTDILGKFAAWMNANKTVQSISHALMSLMPVLMVGAIGSLVQQLIPVPALTSISQTVVNVTTNMLALYAAFAIAYSYASAEKQNGFAAGLISLMCFFLVTPMSVEGEGYLAVTNLPLNWMGAKGLFSAMIIAIISAKIYGWFVSHHITIKMPDSVPPMISNSFAGIIPAVAIGLIFALISVLMGLTPFGDLHSAIYGLIGAPLSNIGGSIWAALLIYVLSGLCWFFGIHGIAVVSAVMPIWLAADAANVSAISAGAAAPNIITYNWINCVGNIGGAGCTLGLILLCTFRAKSKRYKDLGRLAIAPSLFGINEPVVFGFPMMLNPVTMIPFIFTPVILIAVSYVLTIMGILPVGNGVGAAVTIPGVTGFFMGGWRLALWNIIEIVLVVLIYLPSFKKLDAQALAEEQGSTETK